VVISWENGKEVRYFSPDVSIQAELDIIRQKVEALRRLHLFIIHREAIGFRRHTVIESIYRIPAKKRLLTEKNVREDRYS
jgi:hypothetical protein